MKQFGNNMTQNKKWHPDIRESLIIFIDLLVFVFNEQIIFGIIEGVVHIILIVHPVKPFEVEMGIVMNEFSGQVGIITQTISRYKGVPGGVEGADQ